MWTAQDYALVISTLTGLLALGVPPIVSALDTRRAQRAAIKAEIERLLFFVFDNYQEETRNNIIFHRELVDSRHRGESVTRDAWTKMRVEGFTPSLARLKALTVLHRIDDAKFCALVDRHLRMIGPTPAAEDDAQGQKKVHRASFEELKARLALSVQIEEATVQFLTNVENSLTTYFVIRIK